MTRTSINTGLNGFILVDRSIQAGKQDISGLKTFANAPAYLGLESLAQLGAFHVRYITEFKRHAFLLKIGNEKAKAKEQLNLSYS